MAEFGAHLTNSHSNCDSDKNPSIFEVLAQESLSSGLRKAANFVCKVLYNNNPQKFNHLYNNFDEFYLLFDFFVQFCHLRAYNSSFSENFYCLKRVSSHLMSNNSRLNSKQFYSSLLILTAFPYLKSKFDSLYSRLKLAQMESQMNIRSHSSLLFLKTYPIFCSFWDLLTLLYQVSYSVGKNKYHSPLVMLSNVRLCSLSEEDFRQRNANFDILDNNLDSFRFVKRVLWLTTKWMANGLGASLSIGAFFIQFLDFWYSTDNSPPSFAPLPIPPPPQKFKIEIPLETCPICLQTRKNDTALSISGFVFCYSCIRNYLMSNNRCPVTGYPASPQHLIKIFPPDA